jgi:hypothetical protein
MAEQGGLIPDVFHTAAIVITQAVMEVTGTLTVRGIGG